MKQIEFIYERFTKTITLLLLVGMAVVVTAATFELLYGLVIDLIEPPGVMLGLTELYDTFGMFLLILIAIELMSSVYIYLKHEELHLEIMFIVAITAVTRKIIITDLKALDPMYIIGLALLVATLSWGYVYLLRERKRSDTSSRFSD